MSGVSRLAAAAVGCAALLLLAACGAGRFMPATSSGLKVLVFYDDTAEAPTGTVLSLIQDNRSAIWELAPLWYKVAADGSVTDDSQADVKNFARTNHIQLMPLVVNANGTSAFLLNAGNCSAGPCGEAVAHLAAIVKQQNYDGLNIDFELLKPAASAGLTAFVEALHLRLQAMHKVLTVDVIPAGSQRQAQGTYNYAALAKDSNDVVLMTYDAHDDGSAPGPIAPLAWVTDRLNVALADIPSSKLILGLADYGYSWPQGSTHATTLGLNQIDALIAARGIKISRTADGSPHFTYTVNGQTHIVWYEDAVSVVPKIKLARQKHLKALALWMGGYETAAYWNALRTAAGTLPAGASQATAVSTAPASRASSVTGRSTASSPRAGSSSAASSPTSASRAAGATSSSSGAA